MKRGLSLSRWITCGGAAVVATTAIASGVANSASCRSQLEATRVGSSRSLLVPAGGASETSIQTPRGHRILILAAEQRVDLLLEAGPDGSAFAIRADTPYRRAGTIHAIYRAPESAPLHLKLSVKEHPLATGTVAIDLFDLDAFQSHPACLTFFEMMAAGDADYSSGVDIATGRAPHGGLLSRHAYLRATEEYLAAHNAAGEAADLGDQAQAALARAATYFAGLKDWPRTVEWGGRARELATEGGDPYMAARGEYFEAAGWVDAPGPPVAAKDSGTVDAHTRLARVREQLNEIAIFHRRRREHYDSGMAMAMLANAFAVEGQFTQSLSVSRQAAALFHALREPVREGAAIMGTAWNEWGLGDLLGAERHYRQALELTRSDSYMHIGNLTSLGILEQELGRLDKALDVQTTALRLAETLQLRVMIASNLYALGATYYSLGDFDQSIYYLERAASLSRTEARQEFLDLRALSAAYRDGGRLEDAKAAAEAALALAYAAPSKARIQIAIALDEAGLGRSAQALERLEGVLSGPSMHFDDIRVEALVARGRILRLSGRTDAAVSDLTDALIALRNLEAPNDAFQANLELARARLSQGRLGEADAAADRALSLAQLLRSQTANPDLRAQRQEPIRPAYDVKLAIQVATRRAEVARGDVTVARAIERDALVTVERSRAQALRDFATLDYATAGAAEVKADLRRRSELYWKLGSTLDRLDARTDSGVSSSGIAAVRAEVSSIRGELDALNARIAARAARSGVDETPDPDAWSRWLAQNDPDTLIVEYWLGESAAYCWAVDKSGLRFFELGPSRPIDVAARAMHAAMRASTATAASSRVESSAILADLVMRPIEAAFPGARSLTIVPDQALAYVPFPALVMRRAPGPRYLIESRDVVTAPAGWWLFRHRGARPQEAEAQILIVADPVYQVTDDRLAAGESGRSYTDAAQRAAPGSLDRLHFSGIEADMIARQFPSAEVRRLQGFTATRARFLAEPLGRYRYIHVASHGSVDSRMPQLASLVLGEYDEHGAVAEPSIRAADLMALDLHADVVTFSACDTALGTQAVGEGAMGLGYAALARGAHAVLTSLWPVSDEISAEVMTGFYRGLRVRHAVPARALASAMRDVLNKRPALDPTYWAPYQLAISTPAAPKRDGAAAD